MSRLIKQFVLLSGGLDSATLLYWAMKYPPNDEQSDAREAVEAVSINYGQRHSKEMVYANNLCDRVGIKHRVLTLPSLLAGSMLTDPSAPIPDVSYADLPEGISPTYVPFRNGLMLSMLAAHAQKWVNARIPPAGTIVEGSAEPPERRAFIYIGAHAEDAARQAYPDCSAEFLIPIAEAIEVGTYHTVSLEAPFMAATKADIVEMGTSLGVPFEATWSCYKGEELHCGTCPTCRARKEAFRMAGHADPTAYAVG